MVDGLRVERDLTGFTLEADRSARRLVAWLRKAAETGEPRVEVRRFNKGFLHGKAFIAIHPTLPAVLAGSSNFTYAGLARNRELNLGYPSGEYTQLVIDWFDELWDDAEPFDLAAFYEARWMPHPPWVVFLRMLHELYGGDRDDDDRRLGLELLGFQRDGVSRALRLLDDLGGVLVCDEVGLGKTFIAGEIIHQASVRDRQHVLVITPAALKDSTWVPFLRRFNLYSNRVQVVTYDDVRLGTRPELQNLDQYALVVIDEAHNLRNPAAQRSKAVEELLGWRVPQEARAADRDPGEQQPVRPADADLVLRPQRRAVRVDRDPVDGGVHQERPGAGSADALARASVRPDGQGRGATHPPLHQAGVRRRDAASAPTGGGRDRVPDAAPAPGRLRADRDRGGAPRRGRLCARRPAGRRTTLRSALRQRLTGSVRRSGAAVDGAVHAEPVRA